MTADQRHVRHGFGAARPYLHGRLDLVDFVRQAFGAVVLEEVAVGEKSFHVEARIGDSIVVLETGDPAHPSGTPSSVYVYVEDVDAAYSRAVAFGAVPIAPPEDKPYQERGAGVKDSFGNTWWIATYKP